MQQKQSLSVSRVASQPELITNLETQIETQKIKLEEQRLKYKDISMGLAQKIVLMEEQLEEKKLKQEQEMAELELLQREEILQTKKGIEQREAQLIMRAEEYKQRTETAEEQLKKIREEVAFLKNKIETINTFQKDFDIRIMKKNEEIMNFKENVQTYVNLKVS
jgi:chromosome segregation ATPase